MRNPFRYFKTSPEIIRLAVMMYVRFPLSLRQVEDPVVRRSLRQTVHRPGLARYLFGEAAPYPWGDSIAAR